MTIMLMRVLTKGYVIIGGLTWEMLGLMLGLMLLIGIAYTLAMKLPYMKRKGPKVKCQAVTKSKRMEYSNTPQIYYRGNRWDYLITFIKEDGSEVELYTGEANYDMFDDGDKGTLTYQGDKLLEFVWDKGIA